MLFVFLFLANSRSVYVFYVTCYPWRISWSYSEYIFGIETPAAFMITSDISRTFLPIILLKIFDSFMCLLYFLKSASLKFHIRLL